MRSGKPFLIAAAGLVSAVFAYFGTGLHPIWWALWLAPIPVLAISPRLRGGAAFLVAAFAWVIGEMNQWNYVRHQIELPPQITILYFVVPAVVFGLGVLFVRGFVRRGSLFLASLALPVYWVAYEYLTAIASPHSTWGNLAYTQMNCLACDPDRCDHRSLGNQLHCVSVCGRRGSFVERRGNTMATSRARCRSGVRHLRSVCFWQVAIAIKSSRSIGCSDTHRQGRADERLPWFRRASIERCWASMLPKSPAVTPAGTQVVVLPEKIGRISETALAEVDSLYSSAAAETRAAIVLGLVRKTPSGAFNSSRFTRPTENWRRTMTSIISFLVSSPKNPATNE